ncbi:UvrD-helicase domain-containing protein [Raoultella sp. WB_B2P2-3]
MSDRRALSEALNELLPNREQYAAATYPGHCVVIAGPGSGKTKTLTTAMARALIPQLPGPAVTGEKVRRWAAGKCLPSGVAARKAPPAGDREPAG